MDVAFILTDESVTGRRRHHEASMHRLCSKDDAYRPMSLLPLKHLGRLLGGSRRRSELSVVDGLRSASPAFLSIVLYRLIMNFARYRYFMGSLLSLR